MRLTTLTTRAETCARACAIALGFTLPISVALDNVLLAAILALWIASGGYSDKLAQIKRTPVALAALLLFALLVAGLTYGTRYPGDGLRYLGKYADLAFIPIFVTLFDTERGQHYAWLAFAAAMALTLVLSCLLWSGLVTHNSPGFGDQANPSVFKHYLTQNLLMAFSALLFAQLARMARSAWQRRGWSALAVLAAVNVTFMTPGRTGQLVLVTLILYFAYALWRWRGTLAAAAGIAIVAAALMQGAAGEDNRFARGLDESKSWQPGQATQTSVGSRLEFYRNSLTIVREHPLIGVGTGGFPKAYADVVAGSAVDATTNPHDEYLNIAVQLGIAGLLALLHMFYRVWRDAPALPSAHEHMLARGLIITFALGCLFNSLLVDHTEGLLFAWAAGLLFARSRPPATSGAPAR
jgi:O-antigen ligase